MAPSKQPSRVNIASLKELVLQAGEIALARFSDVQPQLKKGGEIVTQADREIEAMLVERLKSDYPEYGIIGEEMGVSATGEKGDWALDPIDGTRAFAQGLPVWGISLGLLEQGRPTQGAFYMPLLREYYEADAHGDARLNDRSLKLLRGANWDHNSFLAVPSDAHRVYDIEFPGVTRALGSTAAHILYVAKGSAIGAVVGYIQLWDIAAALAVLERVGGKYCYLSGQPVDLSLLLDGRQTPEPIIAAPSALLEPLLDIIKLKRK
jgi:myo-inositol-1(or 4)-monophosphatase